jgi:hypothetical protein
MNSCLSYWAVKYTDMEDAKATFKKASNGNKQILFVGMHHVGRQEFYTDVKRIADSLQKLNYTIIYESAASNYADNSKEADTLNRKFRKLMGLAIGGTKGYYDTTTNLIGGILKYKGKYRLVNQYKNWYLMDTSYAKRVDLPLENLINYYEQNYKSIPIDSCDYATPFTAAYSCKSMGLLTANNFKNDIILDYRNKHIASFIHKHSNTKFLIIYGKLHFKGIVEELQELDRKWKR